MFQFGADNWIKYGWGPELKDDWYKDAPLVIDFTNSDKPIEKMPALRAARKSIDHIVANYPAPYTLMCSGGVDSQAMLWAWHTSGHPFSVVSIKYVTDGVWYNNHDLVTLELFTKRHNIPVTYREFDVIDFLENGELQKYAKEYDCHSPQICTFIKMVDQIQEGTALFAGNHISPYYAGLNYTILGLQRYASQTDFPKVIPSFLTFTPELAYSMIHANLSVGSKDEFYTVSGLPVVSSRKLTGFEILKEYYDSTFVSPAVKLRCMSKASSRPFDLLFRYSLEDERAVDPAMVICKTHK